VVISDDDLRALADLSLPGPAPRPIAGVLARGGRLRRRRHAVRAAGVTAAVGGAVAAGLLVPDRGTGGGDVEAGQSSETTPASSAPALLPSPLVCLDRGDFRPATDVPRSEVPEEMRVIPVGLPADEPITVARGGRFDAAPSDCESAELTDTLVVQATGVDGAVTATLRLAGPYSAGDDLGMSNTVPSELRGQPAMLAANGSEFVAFTWAEPDGGHWEIRAEGMDEAGVRAVGEALQLDSSPEDGRPPAQIPAEALPPGFQVVAQAPTVPGPAAESGSLTTWTVQVGESEAVSTGFECQLEVATQEGWAEVVASGRGVGDRVVTVGGRDALWGPALGTSPASLPPGLAVNELRWELAPGFVASLACGWWDGPDRGTLPLEDMVPIAETLEPVAPDDPRLPPE
jgi:hypothetical protein